MDAHEKRTGKFAPIVDPQLVLRGFGLQALRKKFYSVKINAEEEDENASDLTTYLGTPVFSNIELIPGTVTNKDGAQINYGNIRQEQNPNQDTFRMDTVLIDVSQEKQIIKTNIQGVSGTVKEYISKGDYQIKVRGALVEENGRRYPEEQVSQLREYLEVEASIGIASRFLNDIFGVNEIVVEGFSFPQVEGFQNTQFFEFSAISDDPIELTVLNNEFEAGTVI
jgi:hypothetical protein